ncbi:MAG: YcxB family protein [Acidobacteria bacterium]|nr:YcxB family protein [Acidobacteriota bacterium]
MVEQLTKEAFSPPADARHSVEFYPKVDDHVYVSLRINTAVKPRAATNYAFQAFLFINAIAFPAFLLFSGHVVAAAIVFAINFVAFTFILPRANTDHHRDYYQQLFGDREKFPARVEISAEGVAYTSEGGTSFWPWRKIRSIEETNEAIYFFIDGNGFGVQKSGFAYREEERAFYEFALEQVRAHRRRTLPE